MDGLPTLKLREAGRPTIGDAATPDEILDLIRRRQHDIGLSNAGLEHICGLAAGQVDKYLGPTRNKSPTLYILGLMMDAVGVSATLWIDASRNALGSSGRGLAGGRPPCAKASGGRPQG
jgi:hypothetical protein